MRESLILIFHWPLGCEFTQPTSSSLALHSIKLSYFFFNRGLDAIESFVHEGGDPYAYISVDALLLIMNLDGDLSRDSAQQRPNWKNLITAIQVGDTFDH